MRLDHLLSMEDNGLNTTVRMGLQILRYCSILREQAAKYGGLAQLGEHLLCKQGVKGSIPLFSTTGEAPDPLKK